MMFLGASVERCVGYWGADLLSSVVGLRGAAAAIAMSLGFVAMMAGRFAGSLLVRRFAARRVLTGAITIAMASLRVLWLGRSPIVNLSGVFLVGVGVASFYLLIVGLTTESAGARSDRATASLSFSGASALLTVPFIV